MAESNGTTTLTAQVVLPGMAGTHQIVRREFPLLADLVAGVADGDTDRAGLLADHARLLLDLVQVHHDAEETYIWALLPERAPGSAGIVDTMLSQHGDVHDAADAITAALDPWRTAPDAASTATLGEAITAFTTALVAHAALEEAETIDHIATNLTPAEWGAFVRYASTAMPEQTRPTVMGMLMEDMPAPAREGFLANLPEEFATFLRTTGAEAYDAYTTSVRGG